MYIYIYMYRIYIYIYIYITCIYMCRYTHAYDYRIPQLVPMGFRFLPLLQGCLHEAREGSHSQAGRFLSVVHNGVTMGLQGFPVWGLCWGTIASTLECGSGMGAA